MCIVSVKGCLDKYPGVAINFYLRLNVKDTLKDTLLHENR
jgi:hypothetical protein